jgi:hypothetical protein
MGKWLILETEQDFLDNWNEDWERWNHSFMIRPEHFPCAFQYQDSFDPRSCGSWDAISLELAKDNIERELKEDIALSERMLNRLYNLKEV